MTDIFILIQFPIDLRNSVIKLHLTGKPAYIHLTYKLFAERFRFELMILSVQQ